MARKKQEKLEFRYYEMPQGSYVLPLLGEHWKRIYGRDVELLHFHNYLEIGYCYEGEGTLFLDDRECAYFANTFSVIPPNCPHNTVSGPDKSTASFWEYLFVDAEGFLRDACMDKPRLAQELLKRLCKEPHFLTFEGNPVLGSVIQDIIHELRCQDEYYRTKLNGLLMAMFVEIARLSSGDLPQRRIEEDKSSQAKISNALHYIGKHYGENIHIEMLARQCSLSETHFRRVFRDVMNMTPMEYVNFVRIQTACSLMERTDASIEEIAMKTGFISLSTFNRNFRKIMQMPPHQWRRRPKEQKERLRRFSVRIEDGWE